MEIIFAVLVLLLIIVGLRNRKKEKKEWVAEERYEESGAWLDKRSGERGTYGSLDEEMESNRKYIARQGNISALALAVQKLCFEQIPAFQSLSNPQIKQHLTLCKSEISGLFDQAEALLAGRTISLSDTSLLPDELRTEIKKRVLEHAYEAFPKLLDLEIEQIRLFDRAADLVAEKIGSTAGRK